MTIEAPTNSECQRQHGLAHENPAAVAQLGAAFATGQRNATLGAMLLADQMGAYDLLEHQMGLWGAKVAGRGTASANAFGQLKERLRKARAIEAVHGAGCLLNLADANLSTMIRGGLFKVRKCEVNAAKKYASEHPQDLNDWAAATPIAALMSLNAFA